MWSPWRGIASRTAAAAAGHRIANGGSGGGGLGGQDKEAEPGTNNGGTGGSNGTVSVLPLAGSSAISGGGGGGGGKSAANIGDGGSGGGEGGYGAVLSAGSSGTVAAPVSGGAGGVGGTGGANALDGAGGGDGLGIFVQSTSNSPPTTLDVTGSVTGGNGGTAGAGGNGRSAANGLGGTGIVGAKLLITNAGTIAGGVSGDVTPIRADAIHFTGGTNSLTLNTAAANGGLSGKIGLGGTVTIDPGTATTLTSVVHDYAASTSASAGVDGALVVGVEGQTSTLSLSADNTYTGGTTLDGGTLELAVQNAAGFTNGGQTAGGVAFGTTGTTLQIDGAAFMQPAASTGNQNTAGNQSTKTLFRGLATRMPLNTLGTYAAPVTIFAVGETLDLADLAYQGATTAAATYTGGNTLTVTKTTATETLSDFVLASGVPAGSTFVTSRDANGGTDVTLLAPAPTPPGGGTPTPAPAANPTITGTHPTADAGEATVTPLGTSSAGGPVTITDTKANAMDSLTITLSGGGGTLTGTGLSGSGNSYSLTTTDPGTLTSELDALTFTPTAGAPGVANPTTFALAVASNAGTSATDSNTVVTDTAAAAPTPTPPAPTPAPPAPTPTTRPSPPTRSRSRPW